MPSIDSLVTFPLSQPVAIFLLVLVIILFSPLVFDKLRIPRIVGLILAGVIVGPYCLNLLAYDASFKIFGEVGILYLMFLAAIEINMYHLKKNYKRGLFFGLLTFFLPMGGGILLSRYLLNTGWETAALLAVMYAAHTLVTYPVISRFGLATNRGVVVAVTGTIIAVLLSLITLAEVVNIRINGSFDSLELLKLIGFTIVYAVAIGFTYPFIARQFFRKYNDTVAQFIFILAMIFISSMLAELIGLEAILGAFYGGLVLNKFIPIRSTLMRRIAFVGNAIFIPYFLIGVGMLINVKVVFNGWDILFAAAVMSLTALTMKWLAVFITRLTFRFSFAEGYMMFGLSSGKAAATIAAVMIGYQYGLLSETLMNGAVLMILICCIVASIATERAAKRIRMELTEAYLEKEAPNHPGFARQIVAVANPMTSDGITRMAAFMRSPENTEPMTLLYVRSSDDKRLRATGRAALLNASLAAESMHIDASDMERYDPNVVSGLTNTMKEKDATDIVIGLHRKSNLVDSFFGSLTEQLVGATNRMVILSRCYVPVDTLRKIFVFVPKNAEYETGFHAWIARVANLASQLERRVQFIAVAHTAEFIEEFIKEQKYEFSRTYLKMEGWDDFIILTSQIDEDDLLIVVTARKGSLSYGSDLENLPGFIGRHFTRHNIALIYPGQFGELSPMPPTVP